MGVSRSPVEDLGTYLEKGGTVGMVLYNLRHARTAKECKFRLGGGPEGFEEAYHCITVCIVNKGCVQCRVRS
jgi:hypothetical protein